MNSKNILFLFLLISAQAFSQTPKNLIWANNGHAYYSMRNDKIILALFNYNSSGTATTVANTSNTCFSIVLMQYMN